MPGPTQFDHKVYKALERTDYLPDEFKTWLPRYLRYLSAMQVTKTQIPGVMGEKFHNVGDVGEPAFVSPWRSYQGGGTAYGKVRFYKRGHERRAFVAIDPVGLPGPSGLSGETPPAE